jgi:F0F1-type ATP synthase assembly protein I
MGEENRGSKLGSKSAPHGRIGAQRIISGSEFAGIGLQFALTILVFVFVGVWLDRRLGSSPWFLILFVFVGAAAGVFSMYRKVTAAQRRDAEGMNASRLGGKR